eukprot:454221_1
MFCFSQRALITNTANINLTVYQTIYRKTYNINHQLLENPFESHDKCWFWGMLLTDGRINRTDLRWRMKYDSYPMLQYLRDTANSTHPIFLDAQPDGKYPNCELSLYSTKLAKRATELIACVPNRKSFEAVLPNEIHSDKLPALIRGIVDGDGSWTFALQAARVDFKICAANPSLLASIKSVINRECLRSSKDPGFIYKADNISRAWHLRYSKQLECKHIGEWLYETKGYEGKKFHRFALFQEFFDEKNTITNIHDRRFLIKQHIKHEKDKSDSVLRALINMSTNVDEQPPQTTPFRFRNNFYKVQPPQ